MILLDKVALIRHHISIQDELTTSIVNKAIKIMVVWPCKFCTFWSKSITSITFAFKILYRNTPYVFGIFSDTMFILLHSIKYQLRLLLKTFKSHLLRFFQRNDCYYKDYRIATVIQQSYPKVLLNISAEHVFWPILFKHEHIRIIRNRNAGKALIGNPTPIIPTYRGAIFIWFTTKPLLPNAKNQKAQEEHNTIRCFKLSKDN